MMLGIIIAGAVVAALIFIAWLLEFTVPIEAWAQRSSIEYRKNRALRAVRAEGRAARELIHAASRYSTKTALDQWIAQEYRRRARIRRSIIVGAGVACVAAIVIAIKVWAINGSPQTAPPSSQSLLGSVIANIARGECTNFTDNFQAGALPRNPKIVPCSRRDSTFKVAWLGTPSSNGDPCPAKYSNLESWTDSSDVTVCMDRVYQSGQCMQGDRFKGYSFGWYDEAVVSCSQAPTAQYPSVVKIINVYSDGYGSCPDNSYTEDNPDDTRRLTLCIVLWSHYTG